MGILSGKTAIVTGGGRGIGRGIVLELAKEDCDIVIADIDLDNAEQTVAEVRALGRVATVIEVNVAQETSVAAGVSQAIAAHGHIDIVVNNAGVVGDHVGDEIDLRDWDMCYEVNLKGIWIMSQAVLTHFQSHGGGKIVNIASIAGRIGSPKIPHYAASKSGAISLTQSLAKEWGKYNINVNAICPGLLWTDIWRQLESGFSGDSSGESAERRQIFDRMIATSCPLGREQTPEDVGMAVAFLASDRARNITGQALNVDGGIEMD